MPRRREPQRPYLPLSALELAGLLRFLRDQWERVGVHGHGVRLGALELAGLLAVCEGFSDDTSSGTVQVRAAMLAQVRELVRARLRAARARREVANGSAPSSGHESPEVCRGAVMELEALLRDLERVDHSSAEV